MHKKNNPAKRAAQGLHDAQPAEARLAEYKHRWYEENRSRLLLAAAERKEKLRRYATPEQLQACRADPRRAFTIAGSDVMVCLECGLLAALVGGPHLKRHGLTDDQYRERWGYNRQTALACKPHRSKLSRIAYFRGGVRRMRGKQRPTPERIARLLEARRAAPKRREYRLDVGDSKRGQPRLDLQKQTARDLDIAQLRLKGKETAEIGNVLGLTGSSVWERLQRMCFPRGRACLYEHGEPIVGQHIVDTCADFGKAKRELAQLLRVHPVWLSKVSTGRYLRRPLTVPIANRLLGIRQTLRGQARHQAATKVGGRPRVLAQSEGDVLPTKYRDLHADLRQLWRWRKSQDGSVHVDSMWKWLCERSRAREIRTLLFWPQFFKWLEKDNPQELFSKHSGSPQILALQFLADDYHASYETVRRLATVTYKKA